MRLLNGKRIFVLIAAVAVIIGAAIVFAQGSEDDAMMAQTHFTEFMDAPYTDWPYEAGVPADYYVGVEPHGMILRAFVNQIAADDVGSGAAAFSDGAIIVKENHMPGDVDISGMEQQAVVAGFGGNLAALTYMVKVAGYNPDGGDWFWAKQAPDGAIEAAGAPAGCIACHAQVANNDYVFNAKLATP